MKLILPLLVFSLALPMFSQTKVGAPVTGILDATGATRTAPVKTGTSLPATCTVGDLYFKSDAAAGQNIYQCKTTNTWTGPTIAIPPCMDVGGSHLNFDPTTATLYCGVSVGSKPTGTLLWNFGVLSNGTCTSNTLTLPGAAIGDPIAPAWPPIAFNGAFSMHVSAINTVKVVVCNLSGSSNADPGDLFFTAQNTK